MNDRELLDLAAKAISVKLEWLQDCGGADFLSPYNQETCQNWNPLKDDGDAFRLAVKLNLSYSVNGPYVVVHGPGRPNLVIHKFEGDVLNAVRLAIVMAAIEIGKGMV